MTQRTLQHWAADAEVEGRPPGRPPASLEQRRSVLWRVARVVRRTGLDGVGWRTICAELLDAPRRLVCAVLAALKERRRRRRRERLAERAVHTDVAHVGSQWHLDATHLGREEDGSPIQAEVLVDGCSRQLLAVTVGPPSRGADVVALLEAAAAEQGAGPLVLSTDNGSAYVSGVVQRWLAEHQVLSLLSLPRTPQHNARAERAIGLLKQAAEIGTGGAAISSYATGRAALRRGQARLEARKRPVLGGKTSPQAHADGPRWYTHTTRQEVFEDAQMRRQAALLGARTRHAQRRAVRKATLDTLLHHQLITQSRGSAMGSVVKRETVL